MAVPVITLDGIIRIVQKIFIIKLIFAILEYLVSILSKPFYIAGIVFVLTYYPGVVRWIFYQIGLIQVKLLVLLMNIMMPSIFSDDLVETSDDITDIFNTALAAMPADWREIMASLDVVSLIGMITSTFAGIFFIKIMFRIFKKAF